MGSKKRWWLAAFALVIVVMGSMWLLQEGAAPASAGAHAPQVTAASAKRADSSGHRAESSSLASTAASVETGGVHARVLASGRPVPEAEVRLYLETLEGGWRSLAGGVTDAQGELRLEAPEGALVISARKNGFAPARVQVVRTEARQTSEVVLEMAPRASLSGVVVEKGSGTPVGLAEVTLVQRLDTRPLFTAGLLPDGEIESAVADPSGHFHFVSLAPGRYRLEARAEGTGSAAALEVTVPHAGELRVELERSGFIAGFVRHASGAPAGGATIFATTPRANLHELASASGSFSLELPPGPYRVSARLGSEVTRASLPVAVAPGQTLSGLELVVGAGARVVGVVRDDGGAPIAGALVRAYPHVGSLELGRTLSGADGRYALDGLPAQLVAVNAGAPGHSEVTREGLALGADAERTVDFQLPRSGQIFGRVTDARGAPVAGAEVSGGEVWAAAGMLRAQARTDADGSYAIDGVSEGELALTARRGPDQMGTTRQVRVTAAPLEVDFQLADDALLHGVVADRSGQLPQRPVRVIAMPPGGQSRKAGDFLSTVTDVNGRYAMRLAPGGYVVSARYDGTVQGFGASFGTAVTLEEAGDRQLDLQLTDAPMLSGTVVEPEGAPSARALISVTVPGSGTRNFRSGEDGRFELPVPASKDTDVTIRARNGGRTGTLTVRGGGEDLTVALRPAASLHGQVRRASGDPVDAFTLTVGPTDATEFSYGELEDLSFVGGQYALPEVPASAVTVSARSEGGLTGSGQVTLGPGQVAQVDVQLAAGATVSGRVVDGQRKPLAGLGLWLDGDQSHKKTAGSDGRFSFGDLDPGAHVLWIDAPGFQRLQRSVTVAQGGAELGDVVIDAGGAEPGTIGAQFSMNGTLVSVALVMPGGPAEQAGLRVGDAVHAIAGVPVGSAAEAQQRSAGAPGSPVEITIARGGSEQTLSVVRASGPAQPQHRKLAGRL